MCTCDEAPLVLFFTVLFLLASRRRRAVIGVRLNIWLTVSEVSPESRNLRYPTHFRTRKEKEKDSLTVNTSQTAKHTRTSTPDRKLTGTRPRLSH
jgi:hypothetical protein